MADIENWLASNVDALERVADRVDLDPQVVFAIAVLVLAGFEDHEVIEDLRSSAIVPNGRRDPLQGLPVAIGEVRELIATG